MILLFVIQLTSHSKHFKQTDWNEIFYLKITEITELHIFTAVLSDHIFAYALSKALTKVSSPATVGLYSSCQNRINIILGQMQGMSSASAHKHMDILLWFSILGSRPHIGICIHTKYVWNTLYPVVLIAWNRKKKQKQIKGQTPKSGPRPRTNQSPGRK